MKPVFYSQEMGVTERIFVPRSPSGSYSVSVQGRGEKSSIHTASNRGKDLRSDCVFHPS